MFSVDIEVLHSYFAFRWLDPVFFCGFVFVLAVPTIMSNVDTEVLRFFVFHIAKRCRDRMYNLSTELAHV